jgi:hypothetical protein
MCKQMQRGDRSEQSTLPRFSALEVGKDRSKDVGPLRSPLVPIITLEQKARSGEKERDLWYEAAMA